EFSACVERGAQGDEHLALCGFQAVVSRELDGLLGMHRLLVAATLIAGNERAAGQRRRCDPPLLPQERELHRLRQPTIGRVELTADEEAFTEGHADGRTPG